LATGEVVVIETAFPEGDNFRVAGKFGEFIAGVIIGLLGLSWVDADGCVDAGMLVGEGKSGPTGGEIGADGDETGDASGDGASDDVLAISIEVREIKVAVGVDEQGDENNPDKAKGKGKLENLLGEKSGKKILFRHEGNGQKKRMHEVRHSKVVIPESGREKREIENRGVECARIVKRLLFLIDTQVASLKKGGLVLGWEELQKVLLALEAEADGADVNLFLDEGNEISAYVKRSLFDELLGEPSNIFFTTKVDSKTLRYEALPKEFWKECLALLRKSLTELREKS